MSTSSESDPAPVSEGAAPTSTPSTATLSSSWRTPRVRLGGLLLAVGSLQFIVVMFTEEALRPGYSNFSNTISDLGVNGFGHGWQYAWMFNSSVIALGVLGFLGLVLLVPTLPRSRLAYAGEVLIAIGTMGAVAVGLFPEPSTALWGQAHDAASIITFFDANVGMLVLGIALRKDRIWEPLSLATIVLGLVSTLTLAFYVAGFLTNSPLAYWGLQEGGQERIVTFPVLIWAILIGWYTNRSGPKAMAEPAPSSQAAPSA